MLPLAVDSYPIYVMQFLLAQACTSDNYHQSSICFYLCATLRLLNFELIKRGAGMHEIIDVSGNGYHFKNGLHVRV